MKKIALFFVDDILNIIYNNKKLKIVLKNIICQGYIVDRLKFMEEFIKILKKEKIKGHLLGDDIYIVCNSYYKASDKYYLDNIFSELGFLKVIWLPITDLLPDQKATYIEINNSYMVVNFDKGLFLDFNYFNDIPTVLSLFQDKFKDDIVLFGCNKNIPFIKIKNKNVYYFENYKDYITESLLKVKKYGV